MSETTPVQAEATGAESVEFSHFDRTWHVPAVSRLSHREGLATEIANIGNGNIAMCRVYLSAAEMDALRAIDPTDDELDKFTDDMAVALGFKSAGNS